MEIEQNAQAHENYLNEAKHTELVATGQLLQFKKKTEKIHHSGKAIHFH